MKQEKNADGWDWLITLSLLASVVTLIMTFFGGSFLWPVGFFIFAWVVVRRVRRREEAEETKRGN